jgi:hypothetical protein
VDAASHAALQYYHSLPVGQTHKYWAATDTALSLSQVQARMRTQAKGMSIPSTRMVYPQVPGLAP